MYRRILVPLDGGATSERPVPVLLVRLEEAKHVSSLPSPRTMPEPACRDTAAVLVSRP